MAGTVIDDHMGGEFATVVVAVHDPLQGTLTYASAGHPAPLVAGPSRPEAIVAASSPPVGLGLRTGVRQTVLPLPPGSVACLYTDGLAEARTERGVLGRPRLGDMLAEMGREATAAQMLDRVAAEATAVSDDMATIVLVPTAGVTTGRPRVEQLEVEAQEVDEGLADRFLAACGLRAGRGPSGDRRLPPAAPAARKRGAGGHLRGRRARSAGPSRRRRTSCAGAAVGAAVLAA